MSSEAPNVRFTYRSSVDGRDVAKLPESIKSCFLRRSSSDKEMEKFDLQNIIVRSTLTGPLCLLCETRYKQEDMEEISPDCSHKFCKQCIQNYIAYKIKAMEDLSCPQEGCSVVIEPTSHLLDGIPWDMQ